MSMAQPLLSDNFTLPALHPSSSPCPPPARYRAAVATSHGFAKVSALRLAARRASLLAAQAVPPSGADAGKPSQVTTAAEETTVDTSQQPSGAKKISLPDLPGWAQWLLPIYKQIMRIEDEVEKKVETVVDLAEGVAKVTKNVVTDLAESLPEGGLKKIAEEVEELAGVVIDDAEKAKAVIHKVDEIKENVDEAIKEQVLRNKK